MATHSVSHQALVGGYVVLALVLVTTLGLAGWLFARWLGRWTFVIRLLVVLIVGTVSFQVIHFFEHLLQIGYWFAHPGEQPWMTPWGRAAADGLCALLAGHHTKMATGMELLHLVGNWITFVGLIALYVASRSWRIRGSKMRATRFAFWLQLVHVIEHVSLTSTYLLIGRPIGLSTLLGASFYLEGAWASSIRLWWHFVMNLVVTVAFMLAVRELRRAGLLAPRRWRALTKYGRRRNTGLQPVRQPATQDPLAAGNSRFLRALEATAAPLARTENQQEGR